MIFHSETRGKFGKLCADHQDNRGESARTYLEWYSGLCTESFEGYGDYGNAAMSIQNEWSALVKNETVVDVHITLACGARTGVIWIAEVGSSGRQTKPSVPVELVHDLAREARGVKSSVVVQETQVRGVVQPAGEDQNTGIDIVNCSGCLGHELPPLLWVLARTSELVAQAHAHHEWVVAEHAGNCGESQHPRLHSVNTCLPSTRCHRRYCSTTGACSHDYPGSP